MPTSRPIHISPILEEIFWVKPNSILDVGCGFGSMGVLFRSATDVRRSEINPELYHSWPTRIDAIEIFEWYRNPVWQVYTNVYIGNALQVIDEIGFDYDIIYLGDVIEHLSKENGHLLIEKLLKYTKQWLIIATPSPAPPQKEILGNKYEEHLSEWKEEDFKKYNYEMIGNFFSGRDNMLCVRIKN